MAQHQHHCGIVPPYLLQAIAENEHVDAEDREAAARTLQISAALKQEIAAARELDAQSHHAGPGNAQSIVPDSVLDHIGHSDQVDEDTKKAALGSLETSKALRGERSGEQKVLAEDLERSAVSSVTRLVYNTGGTTKLPGKLSRTEGQAPSDDVPTNEAYDHVGQVLDFYQTVFGRDGIDNKGTPVTVTVHYGKDYMNALWTGKQMVFGDGGPHLLLSNFTRSLDVTAHEFTHGVVEAETKMVYQSESGALDESISDIFGTMIEQWVRKQTVDQADWLVGEDLISPGVEGVALRSLKNPGTAFDDDVHGKDNQKKTVKGDRSNRANWSVHQYSGVPNFAFYKTATALKGYSWEKAGQIWYDALTSGRMSQTCTFDQFATYTYESAQRLYGTEVAKIVRQGWAAVGVEPPLVAQPANPRPSRSLNEAPTEEVDVSSAA